MNTPFSQVGAIIFSSVPHVAGTVLTQSDGWLTFV